MSGSARRLNVELKKVTEKEIINGVTAVLVNEQINHWNVSIQGPALAGSLYEGAVIKLDIKFPDKYPHEAPKFLFVPPLLHINVTPEGAPPPETPGEPCFESINNWSPQKSMPKLLGELIDFIKNPEPAHARNAELAALGESNKYADEIKKWAAAHKA